MGRVKFPLGSPILESMARYLILHVQLRHTHVWRRLRVRQTRSLEDLHGLLQEAFGWTDSHLYLFRAQGVDRAASPHFESFDEPVPPAHEVSIGQLLKRKGSRCEYTYDFGDSWEHDIVVEEGRNEDKDDPWLLDGELAGPPEDCGGVPGYERCAEFVRTGVDPYGDDPDEFREWLGDWDPDAFDPKSKPGEIDYERVVEAALAIMSLTLHDEVRAWKNFDWDLMDRMHERGWIREPKGKSKSIVMTPEGRQRAQEFMRKYFAG